MPGLFLRHGNKIRKKAKCGMKELFEGGRRAVDGTRRKAHDLLIADHGADHGGLKQRSTRTKPTVITVNYRGDTTVRTYPDQRTVTSPPRKVYSSGFIIRGTDEPNLLGADAPHKGANFVKPAKGIR